MKRVFILEDTKERIQRFEEIFVHPDIELHVCRDMSEVKAVWQPPYDLVLLDHDLGGLAYVDSRDTNTGAEFVRQYGEQLTQSLICIHSRNSVGAKHIYDALRHDFNVHVDHVALVPFSTTTLMVCQALVKSAQEAHGTV